MQTRPIFNLNSGNNNNKNCALCGKKSRIALNTLSAISSNTFKVVRNNETHSHLPFVLRHEIVHIICMRSRFFLHHHHHHLSLLFLFNMFVRSAKCHPKRIFFSFSRSAFFSALRRFSFNQSDGCPFRIVLF